MKRFQRRDKLKIYMDILVSINAESRKRKIVLTHIQQKSNVPYDRFKVYLSELKDLGLIQDKSSPKLTGKGLRYVTEYEKVLDFMKRMGLTY